MKNDGKSRWIFLPMENRWLLSFKEESLRMKNYREIIENLPFSRSWKLFPRGKRKIGGFWPSGRREEKEEEQPRIRLPGRNACAGGFVVEGWRGDGGGAVADTETSHFSWVWFASRDWPTAGSCSFVSAATYSRSPISAPLGSRTSRLFSRIFHRVDECDTVSRQFSCSLSSRDPSTEYNPGPVLSSSSKSREDVVVLVVNGMETYVAEIYSWVPDSLPNLDNKDFRNLLRSTKGIGIFVFYAGRILFYPRSRLSISLFPRETRPFLPLSLSLEQEGSRKVGSDRFFDDNRVNDSSLSNSLSISLESSPSLRLETDAVIPPPRKLGLEFRTLRVAWQHRRAFDRARAIFPERNRSRNSIGRIFPSVNKEREERRNDGWPPIGLG